MRHGRPVGLRLGGIIDIGPRAIVFHIAHIGLGRSDQGCHVACGEFAGHDIVDDLLKHIGTGRQGGAGNGQYQQDTLRVAPKAATQGIAILFHGMFVIGFAETSRQLVSRCQKKIWHLPAAQNYERLADCQNHLWFSSSNGETFSRAPQKLSKRLSCEIRECPQNE